MAWWVNRLAREEQLAAADMVASMFRMVSAQPDPGAVHPTWDEVRDRLAASFPKIGSVMTMP